MFLPNMTFQIFAVTHNVTNKYKKMSTRRYSSLYYKLSGTVLYTVNGEKFTLNAGDILFIPKSSEYIVQEIEEGEYISLHMESSELSCLPPKKYSLHNEVKTLFFDLWKLWRTKRTENIFMCYSIAYQLFGMIIGFENISYASKSKYNLIFPSLDYMEEHLFDSNLNITKLGAYSGISYMYFYKLFKEFFGCPPSGYIKNKRIAYAKNLFDTGETLSVTEAAKMVGYRDPLYFSKLFKKETGMSPKDYIKTKDTGLHK